MKNFNLLLLLFFNFIILKLKSQSSVVSRNSSASEASFRLKTMHREIAVYSLNNYTIFSRIYKGEKVYICNTQMYRTFETAYSCLKRLNLVNRRNQSIKNQYNPYEKLNTESLLGTIPIARSIWNIVWKRCDYKCFSINNYAYLREGLLKEINMLRQIHNVKPLKMTSSLTATAQKHAKMLSMSGKITFLQKFWFHGETIGASLYLIANTMVNKWYEESKYYNYRKGLSYKNLQMFTQLIWKGSKEIGIGIQGKEHVIYIVCKFYPKGNVRGKFTSNVLPR
ncbi:CAP domain-containing protein [Strongyloides ratti]|uniref:CAP domain-containing protein n=1 Tax=Strongyloides ratti TaxID=34506 RepID=A0A090MXV7_STRRB|nr:CAP domain-containing protein [Strongyloides ratti]CEF66104.2 CAP domain-containing protein [Strongyloides ratti]